MPVAVNSTRPDYDKYSKRWCLVRDVIDSNVYQSKYIPDVDSSDKIRNEQYRRDAQLTNFTARTKAGLVGAVFRREAIIELPQKIDYLIKDCTGTHMPLTKLLQEITGEVLSFGRYGLLVDYPPSQGGLTKAEVEDSNLVARIYRYKPESIINWNTQIVNGESVTSLIVLKECVNELGEDGFEWVEKEQYRVLRMKGGVYTQEIWDENLLPISSYTPLDAKGQTWDYIPFVIVGSEDNDTEVDPLPLYDLAQLNLGHLRNSADYEESVHIVGQPTLIFGTSMTPEEFGAANPNGVLIGARRGHNLGVDGKAEFLQANPNQLADEAMKRKEDQAVMIGARLIVPQADRETAEAAKMRHSGETSILSTIANNVESGVMRCCRYVMRFMSGTDDENGIVIKINDQFFDKEIDPNYIMAQIQLIDKGLVAKYDVRQILRKYGVVDEARTDAQLDAEATPLPEPSINPTNGSDNPLTKPPK